jgi:hypothetical protein
MVFEDTSVDMGAVSISICYASIIVIYEAVCPTSCVSLCQNVQASATPVCYELQFSDAQQSQYTARAAAIVAAAESAR